MGNHFANFIASSLTNVVDSFFGDKQEIEDLPQPAKKHSNLFLEMKKEMSYPEGQHLFYDIGVHSDGDCNQVGRHPEKQQISRGSWRWWKKTWKVGRRQRKRHCMWEAEREEVSGFAGLRHMQKKMRKSDSKCIRKTLDEDCFAPCNSIIHRLLDHQNQEVRNKENVLVTTESIKRTVPLRHEWVTVVKKQYQQPHLSWLRCNANENPHKKFLEIFEGVVVKTAVVPGIVIEHLAVAPEPWRQDK